MRTQTPQITLKKDDQVIVFGNLHGSIFSFMRDLDELERRGLLNNDLVLAENTYLVFLGDIINYAPHTFELLDLVCSLIEKNGDRAIYVRNEQETSGFRYSLAAMREKLYQWGRFWGGGVILGSEVPFRPELKAFFESLPDKVLLKHESEPNLSVICSGREPEVKLDESPSIAAIIMGGRWRQTTWISQGLEFFGFKDGAAFWSLISCPNKFYQDVNHFYYDSFVIVHMAEDFKKSEIEFLHRDMRTEDPFKSEMYSLRLGFPLEKGSQVLSEPIVRVGATVTLTGAVGAIGRGGKAGLEAAFIRANREGGVNGQLIHPIILDDSYIPRVSRRLVEFLNNVYGVDMLVGSQGTPTLLSYLERVVKGDFYLFFPVTGGEQFRLPDFHTIIHCRKSYSQEVQSLIEVMNKRYGATRFAIIYQDDSFGQQLVREAHNKLLKMGIKEWTDIPFKIHERDLTEQAQKLIRSGAEAIGFFFTSDNVAQNFLKKVGGEFLVGKNLFTLSLLDNPLFHNYLTTHGIKFAFSYTFPNPFGGDLPIVQEFVDEMERQHRYIDSNSFEGYVAAALFLEAAKHIPAPITGEKIMRWFESCKDYDFKGLRLTFHPQTRSFEMPVWIRVESDQWVQET